MGPILGDELDTAPPRASDGDRDRAINELRDRAVEGRLSHDTFLGRVDMALRARNQGELDNLIADLPQRGGSAAW
nr:hypothetical protein GCM10020093_056120 [Planobispora longispora]